MAPTSSSDDRHLFTPYNGVPGYEAWVRFERDLLKFGGTADDHGWSYADVFQGVDDGGAAGAALPALPGTADDRQVAGATQKEAQQRSAPIPCATHLQHVRD